MTESTASPPPASDPSPLGSAAAWGGATLRQLVLLIAAFAVMNVGIVLGIAVLASRQEDAQARAHSTALVKQAIAAAQRELGRTVKDNTWFDDAVDRLIVAPDAAWANSYVGASIARTFGVDRVLVLDGRDRPIFLFREGQSEALDRVDLPPAVIGALATRARATPVEDPVPATDLVMFNEELRIAAAGALIYEKPEAAAAQGERGVMIITVPVKSTLLERIAADYLLMNLICVTPDTPTTGPSLTLTASNGTVLAKLAWTLPPADGGMLFRLVPALAVALFVSFIAIGFIYRRLQRVAAERQREAADLATQSALLRVTLETVNQAIGVFDRDRKLIAFNCRYGEIYNLPPGLVHVGLELRRLVEFLAQRGDFGPGDPRQMVEDILLRSEDDDLHVFDRVQPDGTVLEIRRAPMSCDGFVITISDVTARIRTETELRQARDQAETANRAKSSFLANIGHELRTPLNAILGFSEIIKKQTLGTIGTPQYVEYANDIHESGIYLLEIINDILDLSKIEAGRMELHEQRVDLERNITAAIRLCAGRASVGSVTVNIDPTGDTPPLHADERAVKQMLVNLLSNAIKFTPPNGTVTVRCRVEADGRLALRITDTGIGIAEKDVALVLAPFGQVDSALNRRYAGTGLGLPLVKSLIELHGGELILESAVGRGTSVTLRFPAARVLKQG